MGLESTIGESAWADCESVIRRFEDAWRAGPRPDLSAFAAPGTPHAARLLVELVHIDLEFRLRAGEFARAEDYLARFPELNTPGVVPDLAAAEFALRNRHAPPAWPEEFWLRFPEHLADLRARLAPGSSGGLTTTRPAGRPGPALAGPPAIAGYEVLGELGRGGMGVVYKARDLIHRRTVAVKTFATVPRADGCARFAREAEAIARLDHAHIVPVYEGGEWRTSADGPPVPYFVMKWYPGGGLDAAPAGPGTDLGHQARLVETIARAVHHAHQRGVLHRDLKPSNILLDDLGRPHVADFGLAGQIGPGAATQTEFVAGTPAYMAPEQANSPRQVSTAADVYGLGAILYHQLTGRPPFAADTPLATLELAANEPPAPPSGVNPAVPRDLDTICLKCLEKEPGRRYASAAAVADDLERWRAGVPIAARPTPAWEHAWRRVRRHPVMAAMALTTLAALVAAVAILSVGNARIRRQEKETAAALGRESATRAELQDALVREQRALYLERITSAGRLYAANQLPHAWALLDQCPAEFRGWEWHYLDSVRRADRPALTGHEAPVSRVGFLADGRLLSIDARGFARVWDVPAGREQRAWSVSPSPVTAAAVHPRRSWAAVADLRAVTVWDLDSAKPIARLAGTNWVAFSPDGTRAVTSDGPVIRVWKVPAAAGAAPGKPSAWEAAGELRGHELLVLAGVFSPDGRQLVTSSYDRTVRTWDFETLKETGRRSIPTPVTGLAFAENGRVLAEAHAGAVLFTDLATGETRDRFQHPTSDRTTVVSGPDPRTVAVAGVNGEVMVWDVVERQVTRVYRGHTDRVTALAFGPGGQLASGGIDESVRVWDLKHEPGVRTLARVGERLGGLAVSPDGRHLAVGPRARPGDEEPRTMVLDAATGKVLHRLDGFTDVAFDPRSGRLAAGRVGVGGGVTVWDPVGGAEVWSKPFPEPRVPATVAAPAGRRLAFSRDGSRLANWDARAGGVQLWNPADGSATGVVPAGSSFVYAIDFFPDGSRLLVSGRDSVTLWDTATRARVAGWGGEWATALAVSPDGRWVATVDRDRSLRLREAETGRVVREFVGNRLRVNCLAFSPDGTRLLTGGFDRTARVWDVESGRELLSLPGVTGTVTGVAWHGDRAYALDGAVRVWDAAPE